MREIAARELAQRLTTNGLTFVSGDGDRPLRSGMCTIHDPLVPLPAPMPSTPADLTPSGRATGILLGVGVGAAEAPRLIAAADRAGYDAVVLRGSATVGVESGAGHRGIPVLAVEGDTAWSPLERTISAAIAGAVLPDADPEGRLSELADAIAGLLGGAATIEDTAGRVLAYSTDDDGASDERRRRAILGRAQVADPEEDAQTRTVLAAAAPVRLPAIGEGQGRYASAVRLGDRTLGTVWIVDAGQLPDDAELILTRACELVAMQLLRFEQAADFEREQRAALVRTVLTGSGDARAALTRLGLGAHLPLAVVSFAAARRTIAVDDGAAAVIRAPTPPAERTWPRFWTMLSAYLAAWQPTAAWCTLDGRTYVLLGGATLADPDRVALNLDLLVERAAGIGLALHAGLGSTAASIDDVLTSRAEADALATTLAPDRNAPVLTAARCRSALSLWFIARTLRDHAGVLPPGIRALLAHDEQRGTDYARTLATWFACSMELSRTASALGVHRNTLRYRISRAAELSGLGEDPDDLLVAWLSLRLLGQGPAA